MTEKNHKIQGVVVSTLTGAGVRGLKVEAWDKDRKIDDLLGAATTDAEGRFEIVFDESFRDEIFENRKPDVYFRVFQNEHLLTSTEESVSWNVSRWPMLVSIPVDLPPSILRVSSDELSLGARGDDARQVQRALRALGRAVPSAENGTLGAGTVAILRALQEDLDLPPTGVVDTPTVNAINVKLAKLTTESRVVRGSVTPPIKGTVQVFSQGAKGERVIGVSPINATDGFYEVSYQPSRNDNGRVDLRLAVLDSNGNPVETTPSGASILTDAGPLEVIDFVLSGEALQPRSEFELLQEDLKPLLADRNLADLTEEEGRHEISLLALRSGYPAEQVAALVVAHKLNKETSTPAPVFYGLIRQGMPQDVNALHGTGPKARLRALQAAIEQGIVPAESDGKKLEDHLPDLVPSPEGEFQGLLGRHLNASELKSFVGEYLKESQNPEAFWKRVAANPALADRAEKLKLTVQVAGLTDKNDELVNRVLNRPDIKQPSDLARITADEWTSLIQSQGVGVPEETPGANAEEKTKNYVEQILLRVEAAFPTPVLRERLDSSSPVKQFLQSHDSYDLRTTYPDKFFQQNPDAAEQLTGEDRNQLLKLQRVYHLTNSVAETIALVERKGVGSASQIARMDAKVFAAQNRDILSAERAREVHEQARRTNALALALLGENWTALNRTGLHALPRLDMEKVAGESGIPNWETLFGAFDLCTCKECSSAHSPAAYFIDVLQFLKELGAKDALFARRPDLGDIELSCENTNTTLPYVDLVNEILENAVSPPPFVPFTLAPALEDDLDETTVTEELVAAFNPPLQAGARIEKLEDGKRWRIWDEAFAYSVVKENDALRVTARSRQTSGTAAERRATPQYRNRAAYDELGVAVYPWSLPFELSAEEANIFLNHLGVPRRDLIEALRPEPEEADPTSPITIRLAAERLSLTLTERKIIVDDPLTPPRELKDLWGGAETPALATVREMLDRSGLSYAELEALLDTSFINPSRTLTISAKPSVPVATCDTANLQINNLAAEDLSRIHRFVRLQRKLGWTITEVDQALSAFSPNAPSLTNEVLIRISHLVIIRSELRITVAQVLALWGLGNGDEPPDEDTRHADMARRLKLPVQDLRIALELTGLDPFKATQSQDAVRFIKVVKAVRSSGFTFAELDYLLRHKSNPASPFVPTEASLTQILKDVLANLLAADAESDAEKQKSQVIDTAAAALSLPADVTAEMLRRVSHGSKTALELFLELSAITDEKQVTRANDALKPQFEALEKLLKIASILQTLQLPSGLLDWLFREHEWLATAQDQATTTVDFNSWYSLIQFQQLRRELALEDAALEAVLGATNAVAVAANQSARENFVTALFEWLGFAREDVETLVGKSDDATDAGLLNSVVPDAYRGVGPLLKLQRAMSQLKRLGVTAVRASFWCEDSVTDARAQEIRQSAETKHDADARQKIVAPLQDALRDKQRKALVSYLIARPATWSSDLTRADALDLYAHFLVDVEMSSCQLTSRIKQAIGAVQLFAQRALLGLEPEVETSDEKWRQWEWMKSFRVWEANRKVFLYPENLIEPELRDDKTPFFKELENELLQTDLDDAAAEQALLRYLEKLDEVARLEIAGVYEDEDKTLYVFGRTHHDPRIYYYRRCVGATRAWAPWEKIELDIEGDHLIPVVLNRKLMLLWPVFTEKAVEKEVEMPVPGNKLKAADRYWEIQLAWSEYQHGRWSGKSLSEAVSFAAYQGEDDVLFGPLVRPPVLAEGSAVGRTRISALRPRIDVDGDDGGGGGGDDGGDGGGYGSPVPPRTNTATAPRQLVSKELFTFKAFVTGETLTVRGYLRRDYRAKPAPGDEQISCVFGEFRFFGCRKIITTINHRRVIRQNFALAPQGTKFDRMWFTSTGSGLVLFDGQFPFYPKGVVNVPETIFDTVNEPASIAGNPKETLDNKLNIEVLDRTAGAARLLAPHQDLQFVTDRPAFLMDNARTFMITSTGSSRKKNLGLNAWLDADLATIRRADFFPQPRSSPPEGNGSGAARVAAPLTVLAPGPDGRRVIREMVPINTRPGFTQRTLISTFTTTRKYRFVNFHHPYLCDFERALVRRGISGLLSLETQSKRDAQFVNAYAPEAVVLSEHPVDEVEFQTGSAYEIYNWELFFHIPLLIATRLKANQRFAEAQRWFHFIFDPTGASGQSVPQRYWRTRPFFERLKSDYEAESIKRIEEMIARGLSEELRVAVDIWRNNPFSPHAIARLRTTAYQKAVVMKYIDNLIEWGDQLFRRDTLESLNEAMQLYILAAEILGRPPEVIERNVKPAIQTFNSLEIESGGLGNALAEIELLIPDAGDTSAAGDSAETPDPPSETMLYFCVPENDQLLGYWNTVADRLFKLRNCMNIEGRVQQLPLFEPPIDPALLVRARAAGLSIAEVLSDINVALPNYRFSVMSQKASELVAEVRNLGAALLSALEKRDAEALSLLRSGQELRLLEAIREIRVKQIDEAEANIKGLEKSRELAQARKDFYEGRDSLSEGERKSLSELIISKDTMKLSATLRALVVILQKLGAFKFGSPTTAGTEVGPAYIGRGMLAAASALDVTANIFSVSSQLTGRKAEYGRRQEEWDHQTNLATIELKQIEQQLIAAEIRLAVAEQELSNHDQQVDNAREVDRFLHGKFTNQDLYQYMIGRISVLYFQSYQLAYELAKRAERCMQHELGLRYGETSFIRFGYWDSLKKGLLAGDHLAYDLKRLEIAYLDGNTREYELTKHVSLISLDPLKFLALKETGECEFEVPEWLFDLDTPGHFLRRIKMASVTIPCVTGPYTGVHCKLQLVKNSYRRDTSLAEGYDRDDTNGLDSRFVDDRSVVTEIVTSTGQNDAGLFEPAMRDERYLPFEGAGAISTWRLELPKEFQAFDYSTISDVILHLRYTASDGGVQLGAAATASAKELLGGSQILFRLFSLRHEFPSEWHRFVSSPFTPGNINDMTVDLAPTRFPHFMQNRVITVKEATVVAKTKSASPIKVAIVPGQEISESDLTKNPWPGEGSLEEGNPGPWTFGVDTDPKLVEDIFVIFAFRAT